MILYVDMEHEKGRAAEWGEQIMAGRMRVKYRVEEMTGDICLIAHYSRVDPILIERFDIKAVLLSGSGIDPDQYDPADLDGVYTLVREALVPILGLCGGWQFMAQAFGAEITPIGPFPESEVPKDTPSFVQYGMKYEMGYLPVEITTPHPLFEGLGVSPTFFQAHYLEINPPPNGFRVLARSELCETQLVVHDTLPLYGTQFHPEHYTEEYSDGRKMLENFFYLAGVGK